MLSDIVHAKIQMQSVIYTFYLPCELHSRNTRGLMLMVIPALSPLNDPFEQNSTFTDFLI
jgi:hypothetical protein